MDKEALIKDICQEIVPKLDVMTRSGEKLNITDILVIDPKKVTHITSDKWSTKAKPKAAINKLSDVLDDPLVIIVVLNEGNTLYVRIPAWIDPGEVTKHVNELSAKLTEELYGIKLMQDSKLKIPRPSLPDGVIDV